MALLRNALETRAAGAIKQNVVRGLRLGGTGANVSGVTVTEDGALAISAVYACVDLIGGVIATLPLGLYKRNGDSRETAREDYRYHLAHDEPSDEMSAGTFFATAMLHVLLRGNAFAQIVRDAMNRIVELNLLHPDYVRVRRRTEDGKVVYDVFTVDGIQTLEARDMLHFKGISADGIVGISPIKQLAMMYSATWAIEEFGLAFYNNGAAPGVIITSDKPMTPEQTKDVRTQLEERNGGGVKNAHRMMVLPVDMKATTVSITPEQAQFLATRKGRRTEIASVYHVPSGMINEDDRSTFANVEAKGIEFKTYTLDRWLKMIEDEFNRKLLTKSEKGTLYFEFNADAIVRGDITARYNAYDKAIKGSFMTPNEARRRENMPAVPGGDKTLAPLNLTTLEKLGEDAATGGAEGRMLARFLVFLRGDSLEGGEKE